MDNLEYINQKIFWYGHSESIETSAKIYLFGLGYDDVFICSDKTASNKILCKYKSDKFKYLIGILNGNYTTDWNDGKIENKTGIPDLVAIKDENIIFFEIKRVCNKCQDSLSQRQLKWIEEHPQYKVIVLGLELEYKYSQELPQIEALHSEVRLLKKEIALLKGDIFKDTKKAESVRWEIVRKFEEYLEIIKRKQLEYDKKEELNRQLDEERLEQ